MKFKNYIEVQSGIKDSADSPGTLDQVLTSTATGVAWVDTSTISAESAKLVSIDCKNTSGATIAKGTPVYQTGTVGATDVIEIAPADALISAGHQPAIGLLQTTLNNNGFGKVVITGELLNFTTDPIDGVTPTTGDKIFLKSGGGLTLTKPTGEGNGIQNLGLIGKVSGGNSGSITVSSIMRTNDVPNLPTGKIWVGDGNTTVSDIVFLDEPNGRMGIGTTSPQGKLHIETGSGGAYNPNVNHDDLTIEGSGNIGLQLFSPASSYQYIAFGDPSSVNAGYIRYHHGSNQMVLRTNGSDRVVIDSSGNVGIGTTSPGGDLHVVGKTGSAGRIYISDIDNGSAATDSILAMKLDTHAYYYNRDSGDLYLGTNNSAGQLTIKPSGNVGIGTTSPAAKLDVIGDSLFQGRVQIGAATPELLFSVPGGGLDSRIHNDGSGNFIFGTGSNSATPTEKMRIDSSGNVGIGTTVPTAPLHFGKSVYGAPSSENFFRIKLFDNGGVLNDVGIGQPNQASIGWNITPSANGVFEWNAGTLGRVMNLTNAGALTLDSYDSTNNTGTPTYLLGTDASGNVVKTNTIPGSGVGPYLPLSAGSGYPLTGTLYLGNVGGDQKIQFQRTGGNTYSIEHDSAQLYFYNRTSTESPLVIQNDGDVLMNAGNVGIGTTSPNAKLEVNDSSN